jgi:hypothetical protein
MHSSPSLSNCPQLTSTELLHFPAGTFFTSSVIIVYSVSANSVRANTLQSTIDQRAILDLVKINADLGRFGGLIKMWLTTNADFESLSAQGLQRKLENTLSDVRQLQKKMSDRLEDL